MQDTQNTMDLDKSARTDNSQLDISAHSGTSGPKPKKSKKKKKKKPTKPNNQSRPDSNQKDDEQELE